MAPAYTSTSGARHCGGVGGRARHGTGETLLEVLLATWLVALAALGTAGAQLWMVRAQQASASRTVAVSLADSIAEALRSGMDTAGLRTVFERRIAESLPNGRFAVLSSGAERLLITVSWVARPKKLGTTAMSAMSATTFATTTTSGTSGTSGNPGPWVTLGAAAVREPDSGACWSMPGAFDECVQIEVGQ